MRSGKDSALVSEVSVCVSSDLLSLEVAIGECEPPFPDLPSLLVPGLLGAASYLSIPR